MKKLLVFLALTLLSACSPKDLVLQASFGKITLTQAACKNEQVLFLSQFAGLDASKLKAGKLEPTESKDVVELCYVDAKDSPSGKRFVVDERGGMGNFEPDAKK